MPRIYATDSDYQNATGTPPTGDVLVRASRAVDLALIGAVYDVDTAGMPTSPAIAAALHDATLAQARAITASETLRPKSASIGSASYTWGDATPGGLTIPPGGGLCPDAAAELQLVGLTPVAVWARG